MSASHLLRRSKRILGKNKENQPLEELIVLPNIHKVAQEGPIDPPKAKRQRMRQNGDGGNKGSRRHKRILKDLLSMPLDIMAEVFSHLDPLDLLHLARTTKYIRKTLMQRHMTSVWKAARDNVGMPSCPDDLSEPQFASLAFDTHCYYCNAPRVIDVLWACRLRCCTKCIDKHYVEHGRVHEFLPISGLDAIRNSLTMTYSWLPCIIEMFKGRLRRLYSIAGLCSLRQEASTRDAAQLASFLNERRIQTNAIMVHADLCITWHNERICARRNELQGARERRRDAIFQKLTELGYAEKLAELKEFFNFDLIADHSLVKQPKDLTERIWKNIREPLIEYVQSMHKYKMETINSRLARQQILSDLVEKHRRRSLPNLFSPGIADICETRTFRAILNRPYSIQVTRDDFRDSLSKLDDIFTEWGIESLFSLASLLPTANVQSIWLFTSYFQCCNSARCAEPMDFQRILAHRCMTKLDRVLKDNSERSIYFRALGSEPWNYGGSRVQFHHQASTMARTLLELCGFDPLTTETSHMLEHRPEFRCGLCSSDKEWIVFSCITAVEHSFTCHDGKHDWSLFDRTTAPLIASIELNWGGATRLDYDSRADLICKMCGENMTIKEGAHHARYLHGVNIDSPTYLFDSFQFHMDAPKQQTMPTTIIRLQV